MGGQGAIAPMPEIAKPAELDPEVLPEAFAGRTGYPIIAEGLHHRPCHLGPSRGRHRHAVADPAVPAPDEAIVDPRSSRHADRLPDGVPRAVPYAPPCEPMGGASCRV